MNTGATPIRIAILAAISLNMGILSSPLPAAPSPGGGATLPVGQGEVIDWRTSPLDLNLRGLNGERFQFRCPPGKPAPGQVLGSGPYTDGSSICAAAVHAGIISASRGGMVAIEVRPGQAHYTGSLNHYIQSESYESFWSGSFLFVTVEKAPASPSSPAKP